jgi:hypothetical protein
MAMLVPPEALIDGAVQTLLDAVLPDVGTRYARGQLYAVVDVLRNLRDRIEPSATLAEAEAASAARSLAAAVEHLRAAGDADAAARVEAATAAAPPAPAVARAAALREVIVVALEAATAAEARAALESHLVQQALRDVAVLKPSLLHEISKG